MEFLFRGGGRDDDDDPKDRRERALQWPGPISNPTPTARTFHSLSLILSEFDQSADSKNIRAHD